MNCNMSCEQCVYEGRSDRIGGHCNRLEPTDFSLVLGRVQDKCIYKKKIVRNTFLCVCDCDQLPQQLLIVQFECSAKVLLKMVSVHLWLLDESTHIPFLY